MKTRFDSVSPPLATRRLQQRLQRHLLRPADEFFARPHKQVRADLVQLGFLLSGEHHEKGELTASEADALACLGEVLETVHAGSLVVDDIQDQSPQRRGRPSLHCLLGVPLAINLGNWLYFQPLEWIRELNLSAEQELALYRLYHQTLSHAHMGQALDLGTRMGEVPQAEVGALCRTAMHLKTGALMGMALQMGAIVGQAGPARQASLGNWGEAFGVALQTCNDLQVLKSGPERYHDLRLQRPSFVWSLAAETSDAKAYEAFRAAVDALPASGPLDAWLQQHDFLADSCRRARERLSEARRQLAQQVPEPAFVESFTQIDQLIARICHAYV